jgi:glycerol-3-phosphate dehydrogenase
VLDGANSKAADDVLIGGTKGSHIVVPPFPGAPTDAVYFEAKADGRAMFVIPWNHNYLIGTSDIRYAGDLDVVEVDDEEIAYFLDETNKLLPGVNLTPQDVLYAYSGIRPLPKTPAGSTAAITRRHLIHDHAPLVRNLFSIVGGKLTTHRSLAEEAVDTFAHALRRPSRSNTARQPLPGAARALDQVRAHLSAEPEFSGQTVDHLLAVYGARAAEIAALASVEPDLALLFDQETGAIAAEVVFAVQNEMGVTLADILLRRTMVGLASHAGIGPDETAAAVAGRYLGWDEQRVRREVEDYRAHMERFRPKSLSTESH